MIISFSGASGSGKSTLIKLFSKSYVLKERKVLIKEEDNFLLLKVLKKLLGKKASDQKDQITEKFYSGTNSVKNQVIMFVYALIIFLELWCEYIYYELIRRDLVILKDRYSYDYLVTFHRNFKVHNFIIDKILLSIPKPFLSFYIATSQDKALERNRSSAAWVAHTGKRVKEHKTILYEYSELATSKKLYVIANDKTVEESVSHITKAFQLKQALLKNRKIALIGIDGTGKSTLANELCLEINRLDLKCKIIHFYHNALLYQFLVKVGYFKKPLDTVSEEQYAKNRRKAEKINKKGKSFLWALLHYLDGLVQYYLYSLLHPGKILIVDRYFYDFIVSFNFYNVPNHTVFKKFLPRLNHQICLVSDPAVCYERKPENTRQFFEENIKLYKNLCRKENIKVIDTSEHGINQVYNIVVQELING